MRGSRVQAVSNELGGERVDIILWMIIPLSMLLTQWHQQKSHQLWLMRMKTQKIQVVPEEVSKAIGRGGQNVKLASELTGWELNVMSVEQANERMSKNQKFFR